MLDELKKGRRVVGAKQTKRALGDGSAQRIYLAMDADPRVVGPVEAMAQERGVAVERVEHMKELGSACGIAVGAAVAALLH